MPNTPTEDDIALFRAAMSGVKKIISDKHTPYTKLPKARVKFKHQDNQQVLQDALSDNMEIDDISTDELSFARLGVQKKILKKLRKGHFPIQSTLDLHGLTVPQARQKLVEFLAYCQKRDYRCIRIIHGKGNRSKNKLPVLKGKLNRWLPLRNEILAFCSTRQIDGGTGAINVLLR